MATKLEKINYKDYPECMFAMIAACLPIHEGDDIRRVAGNVYFRTTDIQGRTYRNGLLHSYDDCPAAKSDFLSTRFWYKNGKRHRDGDLPAIDSDSNSEWYKDGKRHRDGDLPAVVFKGRDLVTPCAEWWVNGERHRDGDLPAVESIRRSEWWVNGKRHRDGDLPALINVSGYCEWWVNGRFIKCESPFL